LDGHTSSVFAVFGTGAWVAWLLFGTVRQYLRMRSRSAAQDKLLLRVSSPETLNVFLASDPGRQFLRSIEPDSSEDYRSIIRTAQTAVTFAVLGAGGLVCHFIFRQIQDLLPFSLAALILGTAFAASALVSFVLHRRSGLLAAPRE